MPGFWLDPKLSFKTHFQRLPRIFDFEFLRGLAKSLSCANGKLQAPRVRCGESKGLSTSNGGLSFGANEKGPGGRHVLGRALRGGSVMERTTRPNIAPAAAVEQPSEEN